MRRIAATAALCAIGAAVSVSASPALADQLADFYRGRTIEVTVPGSSGGDYDRRARIVSRHLGRFIPGEPNLVVRNMPGGIGLVAANYLANTAPRDGTSMTIVCRSFRLPATARFSSTFVVLGG